MNQASTPLRWLPPFVLSVVLSLVFLAAACSPLRTFNALIWKDQGTERAAQGVSFGSGARQRLDLYRPRDASTALPVMMFVYGGSWQSGSREGYGFVGRALAARGFVVAVPDYRLVPEVRYPAFLEDNANAVRWLRANARRFGGDPDRIVLIGHSAGAYNAAMLALDPRWLGEDRRAVRGLVGLAGPYDFLPLDSPVTQAAFGHVADASTQPVSFASSDDPPALLLHGAKDETVYPRNSFQLAERLRDAGGSADVKLYPRLGHIGILTAIARPFRGKAPLLDDITLFARQAAGVQAQGWAKAAKPEIPRPSIESRRGCTYDLHADSSDHNSRSDGAPLLMVERNSGGVEVRNPGSRNDCGA